MTGPRVAIIQLLGAKEDIPATYGMSCFDFACELMAQGCAVSLTGLQGPLTDEVLLGLADADRVLLWDPDVLFDLPATRAALGKVKLLEALDAADVVSAAVIRGTEQLAVFSSRELFSRTREHLGSDVIEPLQKNREPLVMAAAGAYWLWFHASAIHRLTPPPAKPFVIDGIDVTLTRRLIEGGCTALVDPRLAVTSTWRYTAGWSLRPEAPVEPEPLPPAPEVTP